MMGGSTARRFPARALSPRAGFSFIGKKHKLRSNPSYQPLPWPISHVEQQRFACGPLRTSFASGRRFHFGSDFYSPSLSPNALVEPPQSLPVLPLRVFLSWILFVFRMPCQMLRVRR